MDSIKPYIVIFALISLTLFSAFLFSWPDKNLHYVQCNVGQGDAILISHQFSQILIDSGSDNKVVKCLDKYMPFWDKSLDLLISTHPDKDHSGGFDEVVTSYKVDQFIYNGKDDESQSWQDLISLLRSKKIMVNKADLQILELDGIRIELLWPDNQDTEYLDDNQASIVNRVEYGEFSSLLTGDIDAQVENDLIRANLRLESIVLKLAHHGSKYSSTPEFIQKVHPQLATIGVGKNSYGHPHQQVLQTLKNENIEVLRTDQSGDIEIISNGQIWWLKN